MPEHETSVEEQWLWDNYASLHEYRATLGAPPVDLTGQWIAVYGRSVVAWNPSVEQLAANLGTEAFTPLYVYVMGRPELP
ncbi:hypothetical protein BJY16_007306 [Actinoplanes octamycinicus]|uniref:DUF5678 domain-containing protein n=1 Tax=Actinoplanes octamycinicus TaxID=135948 RepID=A0A7W7H4R5_9ACTN|nr:hypothetical protein [Actinoplanes octamycinicus]MBB4743847.1 hypothetical protein [Actinoplanes octamycinicus]